MLNQGYNWVVMYSRPYYSSHFTFTPHAPRAFSKLHPNFNFNLNSNLHPFLSLPKLPTTRLLLVPRALSSPPP